VSGVISGIPACSSGPRSSARIAVSVKPGHSAVTVTPVAANTSSPSART
jgi:hypothetical protein